MYASAVFRVYWYGEGDLCSGLLMLGMKFWKTAEGRGTDGIFQNRFVGEGFIQRGFRGIAYGGEVFRVMDDGAGWGVNGGGCSGLWMLRFDSRDGFRDFHIGFEWQFVRKPPRRNKVEASREHSWRSDGIFGG
jgi:hypothetical protein